MASMCSMNRPNVTKILLLFVMMCATTESFFVHSNQVGSSFVSKSFGVPPAFRSHSKSILSQNQRNACSKVLLNASGKEQNRVDFFIRPSLKVDMGRASEILAEGFFKHKTNWLTYQWERLETYLSLESCFPKPQNPHIIFVACEVAGGRVLGLAELDARAMNNPEAQHHNKRGPYMCNVAVDSRYQRRGIASALIQRCEQQVQEWHRDSPGKLSCSIHLKVRASNETAIRMYSKLNYMSLMQERDKKGEIVLIMRKELERLPPRKISNADSSSSTRDREQAPA